MTLGIEQLLSKGYDIERHDKYSPCWVAQSSIIPSIIRVRVRNGCNEVPECDECTGLCREDLVVHGHAPPFNLISSRTYRDAYGARKTDVLARYSAFKKAKFLHRQAVW
jgi:hypothetical protein